MPSTSQINITEPDLKGGCPRLNRKFDLLESQLKALAALVSSSPSSQTQFNNPMIGPGDAITGSNGGVPVRVAGNVTTAREFLVSQGTGAIGAPDFFDILQAVDIPTLPYAATGFPGAYASVVSAARSTSLGITNVQHTGGSPLPAGVYIVTVNIATTATGGSVTLTGALGYADPKSGGVVIAIPALTASTSNTLQFITQIRTDGSTDLTIAVTKTGSGTASFDTDVRVIRLS